MDPSLNGPGLHDALTQAANLIPRQEPISVKLVGVSTNRTSNLYQTDLTYEYQFSDKWLLINVATQKSENTFTIIGLGVTPIADSVEHSNRFSLSQKTPLQYGILAWGTITVLFILYCLILCSRAKNLNKKWLWILFILFGFGGLSVNWATGKIGFSLLSIQLFGFSAFAAPYGPWILTVSLPVGALLFLLQRKPVEPTDTYSTG